jgi:hypothetical protein
VHRHEEIAADELVKLDVMDVATGPELGSMQHDERVLVVDVHLRDVIALDAVADRQMVKSEHVGQQRGLFRLTDRQVDPDQRVGLREQQLQIVSRPLLDPGLADRVHIHRASPFVGSDGAMVGNWFAAIPGLMGQTGRNSGPSTRGRSLFAEVTERRTDHDGSQATVGYGSGR